MKAIILAAGRGTRLQSVEPDIPKPMVKLQGKPILQYTIEHMVKLGIKEIVLTIGPMKEQIMDYFGDGERFGVPIRYSIEASPLGTAGGVKQAMAQMEEIGNTVAVWHGDNFSTCDLNRMRRVHHECQGDATIAVCYRVNTSASSILEWTRGSRITHFEEKPRFSRRAFGWVSAGIYIIGPEILPELPDAGDFGLHVFPRIVARNAAHVYGLSYDETFRWYDTPEDLQKLREDYENH